jgi:biopolymer transport protein ExbB
MWTWLVDFFREGGPIMVPLATASVAAVAIIIERAIALRRARVISPMLAEAIEGLRPGEGATKLHALAEHDHSSLGAIVRVVISHLDWPKNENIEAVQTRARAEAMRLEHGLVWLEVITGISPLLGLLGTLGGLKYLFKDIGRIATETGTTGLGIGISHALNCTFFGLLIAIIALIGWSYFNRRVERMMVEMESMTSDLLAKLYRESNGVTSER